MNPPASVEVHGTISRLALKRMANIEFGIRGKVVTFGELVCLFDLVNTACLDIFPSFVLATWKLKVIPLFMGQRLTDQTYLTNPFVCRGGELTNPRLGQFKFQCP